MNKLEEEKKRNTNIAAKMYLLCYPKPRTITELQKIIWDKKKGKNYIYEILPELWTKAINNSTLVLIKPIQDKKNKNIYHLKLETKYDERNIQTLDFIVKKENNQERIYDRSYYISNPIHIIKIIEGLLEYYNKSITFEEKKLLYKLIHSHEFRASTERFISNEIKKMDLVDIPYIFNASLPLVDYLTSIFLVIYTKYLQRKETKDKFKNKLLSEIKTFQYSTLKDYKKKLSETSSLKPFIDVNKLDTVNVNLDILKNLLTDIIIEFEMNFIEKIASIHPAFYETVSFVKLFNQMGMELKEL